MEWWDGSFVLPVSSLSVGLPVGFQLHHSLILYKLSIVPSPQCRTIAVSHRLPFLNSKHTALHSWYFWILKDRFWLTCPPSGAHSWTNKLWKCSWQSCPWKTARRLIKEIRGHLSSVSMVVIKHIAWSNMGREEFISVYWCSSLWKETRAGAQSRNMEAGTKAKVMEVWPLLNCSSFPAFLYNLELSSHGRLGSPTSIIKLKDAHRVAYGPVWWWRFFFFLSTPLPRISFPMSSW